MDSNPSIRICQDMKEHLIGLTNDHQQAIQAEQLEKL
jgi:hypothetical protein